MFSFLPSVAQAQATLSEVHSLMKQGQYKTALTKIEQLVAAKPKDAEARFTKGVILTELNRPNEAIQVYQKLTEDYPALPEPYNNLAVIYASQKQYEKARDALEQAIHTHPAYATAHENLGDIYAKLASQAYDKALQLDSGGAQAQPKLASLRDLSTMGGVPSVVASTAIVAVTPRSTASTPVVVAAPRPAASTPTQAEVVAKAAVPEPKPAPPAAASSRPVQVATAPQAAAPVKPPAKAETSPASRPVVAETKGAPKETKSEKEGAAADAVAVNKAVHEWAAAWSRKDVRAYLGFYAKDFRTPNGQARGAWEDEREARITKPGPIEVGIVGLKVSVDGETATARFRQAYSSTNLKTTSTKTLVLGRRGNRWQILQERVGA